MRKAIKAVLFSALLFPGTGHFAIKRYRRGMIFFVPALLSLASLVYYVVNKSLEIAEQIAQYPVPLDMEEMAQLIQSHHVDSELYQLNIAAWILGVCWIISIVDSFFQGRALDRENRK